MMKKNFPQTIILLLFMLVTTLLSAQDFQGVATYKTSLKMDFKLDTFVQMSQQDLRGMEFVFTPHRLVNGHIYILHIVQYPKIAFAS